MAFAVLLATPGCSAKTADTDSAVGTTGSEVAASAPASAGAQESTGAAAAPGALGGAEPQSDKGTYPPNGCGSAADEEPLWRDVENRTEKDKGPNIHVVDVGKLHYALHDGNRKGETHKYNLLVIPTARVTGIECDDILDPTKVLNLWDYAWKEARNQFKSEDVMLGINSMLGRSHKQLHIHIAGFNKEAREQLDKLTNVPTELSKWNESMHVLGEHAYRIVRVKNLDTNPFQLLQDHVSKPSQDRFDQSLVVVADTKNGGYYLIATQGKPKEPGQPNHNPELRIEQGGKTYWGSEAIDDLMYLG